MKITRNKTVNNWTEYTLSNDTDMSVSFLDYGGIITRIMTPNRDGQMDNVVLSYENYDDYKTNPNCFGSIIGRVAGRIEQAQFTLNNKTYHLKKNEGDHHIHGGDTAFHHRRWETTPIQEDNRVGVMLTHTSPDGEGGYPGCVSVSITYWLTKDNDFIIDYNANSDQDTVLTLTNHTYFNLTGLKYTVRQHVVTIDSDQFLELDDELIPTGKLHDVSSTPFDMRRGTPLNKGFHSTHPQNKLAGNGYDHYFLLNETEQPTISVEDKHSGRTLSITTNQPGVVMYTANGLENGLTLQGGISRKHLGVCFETQGPPASLNHDGLPSIMLKANDTYNKQTVFSFSYK